MNNLLNIKSFLKFLSRNKGYTAIDVFGLSVSLMFVILIAVYVEQTARRRRSPYTPCSGSRISEKILYLTDYS